MTQTGGKHSFDSNTLVWGIVGIGIALRLAQYLYNRSLWSDEVWVVLNIIDRSWSGLFQSLDYDQGAPIGFLITTKCLIRLCGDSEYILRLFPLLCSILALVLFYKTLARLYPENPNVVILALSLFAISERLIYYATECKQYSSDALVSVQILYVMLPEMRAARLTRLRVIFLGTFGAIVIWFAHPAVFVLAGVGLTLAAVRVARKDWSVLGRLAIVYSLWGASFMIYYAISLRTSGNNAYLLRFWSQAFMPFPPSSLSDGFWFVRHFLEVIAWIQGLSATKLVNLSIGEIVRLSFAQIIALPLPILAGFAYIAVLNCVAALAVLVGCAAALSKNKAQWLLLVSPALITLLASGLRKYPFDDRLILFLMPFLLPLLAVGAEAIRAKTRSAPVVGTILIGLVFLHPILSASYYIVKPRTVAEVRPVLAYVHEHRKPEEALYLDGPAGPELLRYYRYDPTLADYIGRNTDMKDIEMFGGHARGWVLFSDTTFVPEQRQRVEAFLRLLDSMGIRRDAFKADGAEAYLYDFAPTLINAYYERSPL